MLARLMDDKPLPLDHGAPVPTTEPGYGSGGRAKWLQRIWVSDQEIDSPYLICDNRVLHSFITEEDEKVASTTFAYLKHSV